MYEYRLLETEHTGPLQAVIDTLETRQLNHDPRRSLNCATCTHPVTHESERLEVAGASEHVFTNPHGYQFHIVCFHEALGCISNGEFTAEYSWFHGHLWRYALCGHCQQHLGWQYRNDSGYFYGLIKNRLIERSESRQ